MGGQSAPETWFALNVCWDQFVDLHLKNGQDTRAAWVTNLVEYFLAVENHSLVHLYYEQRLAGLWRGWGGLIPVGDNLLSRPPDQAVVWHGN